jgi:hypothetical protein
VTRGLAVHRLAARAQRLGGDRADRHDGGRRRQRMRFEKALTADGLENTTASTDAGSARRSACCSSRYSLSSVTAKPCWTSASRSTVRPSCGPAAGSCCRRHLQREEGRARGRPRPHRAARDRPGSRAPAARCGWDEPIAPRRALLPPASRSKGANISTAVMLRNRIPVERRERVEHLREPF